MKCDITDRIPSVSPKLDTVGALLKEMSEKTDELKRFLALWEQAVCEIRARNEACDNNAHIAHLCDKLESSMVAYAKGNVEYAHFVI